MGEILAAALLLTCSIALILYSIYRFRRKALERERKYLELQQILLKEHYSALEEKMELSKRYQEDIRKYMERLKKIVGKESVFWEYQQEAAEDFRSLNQGEYCDNPVLNSIFRHKREECEACGIRADIQISGLDGCNFRDMDMVGILYNLFDNAIEACRLIPDMEKRKISVSCCRVKNKVTFVFENTRNPNKILREGLKTWKKNQADHGIGLEVLYELVQRNNGRLIREEKKDIYKVQIVLPVTVGQPAL